MSVQAKWLMLPLGLMILSNCDPGPEPDPCAAGPSITVTEEVMPDCNATNGRIIVSASGGTGEFLYQANGSTQQTSGTFDRLGEGAYTITAVDGNGCDATVTVDLVEQSTMVLSAINTNSAGCDTQNGIILVEADGGVPPYMYSLDGGQQFQSSNSFSGLGYGHYTALARDATGCEVTKPAYMPSGISYSQSVANIIQTNCAIAGCHGDDQGPIFTQFATIQSFASRIKVRTGNGSMPPDGQPDLTPEEIQAIACWVDDGARNN